MLSTPSTIFHQFTLGGATPTSITDSVGGQVFDDYVVTNFEKKFFIAMYDSTHTNSRTWWTEPSGTSNFITAEGPFKRSGEFSYLTDKRTTFVQIDATAADISV